MVSHDDDIVKETMSIGGHNFTALRFPLEESHVKTKLHLNIYDQTSTNTMEECVSLFSIVMFPNCCSR